jgi:hypothetical protein
MKQSFHSIKMEGKVDVRNSSVLLIANHTGWWDGFWALFLSTSVFQKKYHFMMLEPELRKRMLFNYSGGFSVAHGSRSSIESLNYSAELLQNSSNLVLMFPQAKMHSIYNDNLKFERGIEYILKKCNTKPKIVFLATLVDYFEHPKPDVYFYISEYEGKNQYVKSIESAYNSFIQSKIELHKQMYK